MLTPALASLIALSLTLQAPDPGVRGPAGAVRRIPATPAAPEPPRPASALVGSVRLAVPPLSEAVHGEDLDRFEELGTIDLEGFKSLLVSGAGRLAGTTDAGAGLEGLELLLLPDVPAVEETWQRDRVPLLLQRIRLDLELRPRGLVALTARPFTLRFPRYRAWIRNRTGQGLQVELYLFATD